MQLLIAGHKSLQLASTNSAWLQVAAIITLASLVREIKSYLLTVYRSEDQI